MTDPIDRTHGSTGEKPPDGKEFVKDERPDESHFDWWWYTVTEKINSLIGDIGDIADGTTKVGAASSADTAGSASKLKGNDIDTDGDGKVDAANIADQSRRFEVRTSDPNDPDDGQVWIIE